MIDEPKEPHWPLWIRVMLTALVLYPLSFGPACWISSRHPWSSPVVGDVYYPLARVAWSLDSDSFGPILRDVLSRWGYIGEPEIAPDRASNMMVKPVFVPFPDE